MSKLIVITEICSDGSATGAYDYDLLPTNVKRVVDIALTYIRTIRLLFYSNKHF